MALALVMLYIDALGDIIQETNPTTATLFKLVATICVIVAIRKRR
ncbi:hypothetical protein [Amycolatopsis sp. Hca4]|nr:hypothetical protein [Amycolatopsis sp. Hca4]